MHKLSILGGALALICACATATEEDPYILETNVLPDDNRLLPSVANGHLGAFVWHDSIYVNGVYNGYHGESHRARIKNILSSRWEACPGEGSNIFRLDMRQGIVSEIQSCPMATVEQRIYAHGSLNRVLISEIVITRVDGQDGDVVLNKIDLSGLESDSDFDWQSDQLIDDQKWYKTGTTTEPEIDESNPITVHIYYNEIPPETLTMTADLDTMFIHYYMTVDVDQNIAETYFDEAQFLIQSDPSGNVIRQMHLDTWTNTWNSGNIVLEGDNVDNFLEETLSAALYYIFSSLPAEPSDDKFFGMSPGSLARGHWAIDYLGHVFWDMETWMYPPVLMFRPDLAKAMLKYRIQCIDQAQIRAQDGGYNGARYPWESAYTGYDVTPEACPACRENQQHITGDIAWGARTFVAMTQDVEWLTDVQPGTEYSGNEWLVEMARFWESRPTFSEEKNMWEINGVMPPDEYHSYVNNSIYTNLLANLAVNTARWTTCLAEGESSAINTIPDDWLEKMENLVFMYNEEYRYHEEFEGFDEEYRTGSLDDGGIKQADVVLLAFPLLWDMPDDVRRNDLELYEPITTTGGPAMTWSIFAIGYMMLEDQGKTEEFFAKSYEPYVREPYHVWTETQSGVGAVNFITGAGGFLQALVFGYAGMRVHPYSLEFTSTPFLPPTTDAMTLVGLEYLGSQFDLRLTTDEATFTCYQEPNTSLEVMFDDGSATAFTCDGSEQTFQRIGFHLQATSLPACDPPADQIIVDYG